MSTESRIAVSRETLMKFNVVVAEMSKENEKKLTADKVISNLLEFYQKHRMDEK